MTVYIMMYLQASAYAKKLRMYSRRGADAYTFICSDLRASYRIEHNVTWVVLKEVIMLTKWGPTARTVVLITIGAVLFAIGINAFIVPHKLVGGGISGIA